MSTHYVINMESQTLCGRPIKDAQWAGSDDAVCPTCVAALGIRDTKRPLVILRKED